MLQPAVRQQLTQISEREVARGYTHNLSSWPCLGRWQLSHATCRWPVAKWTVVCNRCGSWLRKSPQQQPKKPRISQDRRGCIAYHPKQPSERWHVIVTVPSISWDAANSFNKRAPFLHRIASSSASHRRESQIIHIKPFGPVTIRLLSQDGPVVGLTPWVSSLCRPSH